MMTRWKRAGIEPAVVYRAALRRSGAPTPLEQSPVRLARVRYQISHWGRPLHEVAVFDGSYYLPQGRARR